MEYKATGHAGDGDNFGNRRVYRPQSSSRTNKL